MRNSYTVGASAVAVLLWSTAQAEPIFDSAFSLPTQRAQAMIGGEDWSGFYAGAQLGYSRVDTPLFDEQASDLLYGLHAGYNYDLGNFVVGGELDYDWTQIGDSGSGIELESVARLKVRAGLDAGAYMPFVTLGAAQAWTSGAASIDDRGIFGGVGVDYKLSDTIRVGGEILQHKFEDFGDSGSDIDATTLAARVSYSF